MKVAVVTCLLLATVQATVPKDWIHAPARAMESLGKQTKLNANGRLSLISEQGQARQGVGAETTRLLSKLGMVETKVADLMRGNPEEMHREENLLHQAAQDALVAGEAKVRAQSKKEHLITLIKNARALAQVRSNSTFEAKSTLREGAEMRMLTYGDRISKVANDDRHILSETKMVEQKVQAALKGKNASLSARVTKLLDMAQDKIREVASSEDHIAQEARKEALRLHTRQQQQQSKKSSAAQVLSRVVTSRAERRAMRQRAVTQALAEEGRYAAGETALAKDGQKVLSEMSQLKGMVAQAFANTNSQGVEKAMEVGELLDTARDDQRRATELNEKQAKDVSNDMKKLSALMPAPVASSIRVLTNASLSDQQHLLQETMLAEKAINASFDGNKTDNKTAGVRNQVFALMEKARLAEQGLLAAEAKAVGRA